MAKLCLCAFSSLETVFVWWQKQGGKVRGFSKWKIMHSPKYCPGVRDLREGLEVCWFLEDSLADGPKTRNDYPISKPAGGFWMDDSTGTSRKTLKSVDDF